MELLDKLLPNPTPAELQATMERLQSEDQRIEETLKSTGLKAGEV